MPYKSKTERTIYMRLYRRRKPHVVPETVNPPKRLAPQEPIPEEFRLAYQNWKQTSVSLDQFITQATEAGFSEADVKRWLSQRPWYASEEMLE